MVAKGDFCMVPGWRQSVNRTWSWTCQNWTLKDLSILKCWKRNLFRLPRRSPEFVSRLTYWRCFWKVEGRFGPWRIAGHRWGLQLVIQRLLLILIGVRHLSLLVTFAFASGLYGNHGVFWYGNFVITETTLCRHVEELWFFSVFFWE